MKTTILFLMVALAGCGGASGVSASTGNSSSEFDGGILIDDGGTCDCTGKARPMFCMVCDDGRGDCVHYACTQGQCGVKICE